QLGFSQYEAQCYLGLLRQHPLNGSQLSTVCGVPRSMVYQTLNRLEEKAAVVRLSGEEGEPQQYEPVAPKQVIAHLSARFQATCEHLEEELDALIVSPPAEVVFNIIGMDDILKRGSFLLRQAQQQVSLIGRAEELTALEPDLRAAAARGVLLRIVSQGSPPALQGQVVAYLGENVSAPTRFLLLVVDATHVLMATFSPQTASTALWTENQVLAHLLRAFLNTQYYNIRLSNKNPALAREVLSLVLEPEDQERYAPILHFLEQQAVEQSGKQVEKEREV
ncbi:MAG TPA: helix-turn-helix domain-containing protein, partial [Ktedonobacteraceae bacterium]|nr:helix-turn-helix domain-containing protein [Ktedonobacteraceae bacterium]